MPPAPLLCLVLLTLLATACDWFGDPYQGPEIGLSLSGDAAILIEYNPCGNAAVLKVRLLEVHGRVFGDENDAVLWEVEALTPSSLRSFTVGETPAGFVGTVRVKSSIDGTLAVVIDEGDGRSAGRSFSLDDIRVGQYQDAAGRYWDRNEFRDLDACDL